MITGISLSLLLFSALFIFYWIDFAFLTRYDRERKQGQGWAWDYTLLTLAASALVVVQPWLWPRLGFSTRAGWGLAIQILGLACLALSFGLHIWARRHLQKFYAERVEIQPDHQVIQSGPYALMRHPLITSFFLLAGGLFLLNPALTTLLGLFYTIHDFTRAARQEEELLSKNLPGYTDYMKRVPRFIPSLPRGRK